MAISTTGFGIIGCPRAARRGKIRLTKPQDRIVDAQLIAEHHEGEIKNGGAVLAGSQPRDDRPVFRRGLDQQHELGGRQKLEELPHFPPHPDDAGGGAALQGIGGQNPCLGRIPPVGGQKKPRRQSASGPAAGRRR